MSNIRYSKEKLKGFKERILVEIKKVDQSLSLYDKEVKDPNGDGGTISSFASVENSNEGQARDLNSAIRDRLLAQKSNLNRALIRIETGEYGIDPDGKLISEERLNAHPCATQDAASKDRQRKAMVRM